MIVFGVKFSRTNWAQIIGWWHQTKVSKISRGEGKTELKRSTGKETDINSIIKMTCLMIFFLNLKSLPSNCIFTLFFEKNMSLLYSVDQPISTMLNKWVKFWFSIMKKLWDLAHENLVNIQGSHGILDQYSWMTAILKK